MAIVLRPLSIKIINNNGDLENLENLNYRTPCSVYLKIITRRKQYVEIKTKLRMLR